MFYWNPLDDIQEWSPKWNKIFSEEDKIQGTHLYFFFKRKGIKENISEILVNMVLFKQKYNCVYSCEQERILKLIRWK